MATQLAERRENPVEVIRENMAVMAPQFKAALPAHVSVEKFTRVAMTAIQQTPDLQTADRRSLFASVVKLAQDGLLPDGREAALVIFNTKNRDGTWTKKVQAMPMIAGLLKLMRQSKEVAWVDAHIVCENDRFVYRPGLDDVPEFEPDWFGNRGKAIGAYAIAKLKSGEIVPPEIMSLAAIEKVRAVSRSKDRGPWVDWWEQQALKTVLRRYLKRLPTSADVEHAFDRDETMQAHFDGEPAVAVTHEPVSNISRLDQLEHHIEDEIDEQAAPQPEASEDEGAAEYSAVEEADFEPAGEEPDEPAVEPDAEAELSPAEQFLAALRERIAAASTKKALDDADKSWTQSKALFDDTTGAEIEGLFAAKRKELAK